MQSGLFLPSAIGEMLDVDDAPVVAPCRMESRMDRRTIFISQCPVIHARCHSENSSAAPRVVQGYSH